MSMDGDTVTGIETTSTPIAAVATFIMVGTTVVITVIGTDEISPSFNKNDSPARMATT